MILLFPIMKPNYIIHIPLLNFIYQYMLLFTLCYCVLLYLKRKKIPSRYVWLFLILEIWLYFVTSLNNGDLPEVGRMSRGVLGLAFIFDLFSDDMDILIKCFFKYFVCLVSLNFLLMLLFPQGIYSIYSSAYSTNTIEWLFGVGNSAISWHFPAVVISWIYSKMIHNDKYAWYMSIIALIANLIDGSATATVGILMILLIQNVNLMRKILKPKIGVILATIFFLLIVIFQNFDYLQPIIVGFLGKDMTFTGRLAIWNNAVSAIKQNPIIGHGVMYSNDIIKILGALSNTDIIWEGATHCHDNYLQIAFTGGLIAIVIYFKIYYIAIKKLTIFWKNPIAKACTAGLIAFLIIQISEVFDNSILMYIIIFLSLYIDKLIFAVNRNESYERKV